MKRFSIVTVYTHGFIHLVALMLFEIQIFYLDNKHYYDV